MHEESDSALIARTQEDPQAFGLLYERYVDRIYNYIYYRVGNTSDVEDLTARTFFQAMRKIDSYEDRGIPFSAWLYRIAHNLVANWHRQQSRRKSIPLDEFSVIRSTRPHPSQVAEQQETQDELLSAIHRLAEDRLGEDGGGDFQRLIAAAQGVPGAGRTQFGDPADIPGAEALYRLLSLTPQDKELPQALLFPAAYVPYLMPSS